VWTETGVDGSGAMVASSHGPLGALQVPIAAGSCAG